jgi:hypothetical protein
VPRVQFAQGKFDCDAQDHAGSPQAGKYGGRQQ